jgi:hypothetical protein
VGYLDVRGDLRRPVGVPPGALRGRVDDLVWVGVRVTTTYAIVTIWMVALAVVLDVVAYARHHDALHERDK